MKERLRFRCWTLSLLAALLLLLLNGVLEARIVVISEVRQVAARLLEMENLRPDLRLKQDSFQLDGVEPLFHRNRRVAYLVNFKPQGFMILSDITEVSPQVFVSFSGNLETLCDHPFLVRILDRLEFNKVHLHYLAEGIFWSAESEPEEVPDPIQMELNELLWSALLSDDVTTANLVAKSLRADAVSPMLTSTWGQWAPYNDYTPRVGGKPTPSGCVATAMAQVMYFWRYPARGQGSHSYLWKGQTLSANFNHEYFWERMRSDYSSGYSGQEADAVARLMSDVGIAVDMEYDVNGSGSIPGANRALSTFFKFSPDAHPVDRSDLDSWATYFNVVKQQLDLRQPVILSINKPNSGHSVVADGYRTSPSNQVHINMGWESSADNYYSIDYIYGYGDIWSDYAYLDIHPVRSKLTLQTSAGGTTDPAPGTHDYGYGTEKIVRVTALPNSQYELRNWSGDASGTQNPIDITVDREKTVKANFGRIVYAPLNAAGHKVLIRSLSQAQYINIISFAANPNNVDIQRYKIVQVVPGGPIEIASLNANTFLYWHRSVDKSKTYCYYIIAVNSEGREGPAAYLVI